MTKEEYISRIESLDNIKNSVEREIANVETEYIKTLDFAYNEEDLFEAPVTKEFRTGISRLFILAQWVDHKGNKGYCCDIDYNQCIIDGEMQTCVDTEDYTESALKKIISSEKLIKRETGL